MELQSKWVAQVLSGKVLLPNEDEMTASTNEFYRKMQELGLPKRSTHFMTPYQLGYINWLCAQIGLPPLENWRFKMYEESIKNFIEMRDGYKDHWDDAYWEGIIQVFIFLLIYCDPFHDIASPIFIFFLLLCHLIYLISKSLSV
ncbi:FAD/NAD(P)-binding domain containing protein [Parasponia andersonii]|uniref:FAD/NAD(P)-binding domain containing protein n=1 Tax=Parasponia andersonii TaxID=3476 RepID=A0A2P5DM21_PARAD|nr:FAD/NAD(P)-binding domain containing protein [Parasponia andersonii]